jgi:hypothetical protein
VVSEEKGSPFSMSEERGEELFRALNGLIKAISVLHLVDLEAATKGQSSAAVVPKSKPGPLSSSPKGKAKVENPDWKDIPYNPVLITPLSKQPRFTQVVGSSSADMATRPPPRPPAPAAPPPLAYNTAEQFYQMWDGAADAGRQALEQQAMARSPVQEVQMAAMLKYNVRLQATIGTLTGQVGAAQAAA